MYSSQKSNLPLVFVASITSIALFERLSEVVAPRLGIETSFFLALLCIGYLIFVPIAFGLTYRIESFFELRRTWAHATFLGLWGLLILLFIYIYPLADAGTLGFQSDREEALDIGVRQLWDGNYPYYCRVVSGSHDGCPQNGNVIGPMPGGILLASPVVFLFGSAAWLSLLSLPLLYVSAVKLSNAPGKTLSEMVLIMLIAPILVGEILTGGDLLANTLAVSLSLALLLAYRKEKSALLFAFLLAVALSWRGLFWLIAFPAVAYFIRAREWRDLLKFSIFIGVVVATITLPFYLYDPDNFSPWAVQQRFTLYRHISPYADVLLPVSIATVGVVLGWRARSDKSFLFACGIVVLLPILASALLNSIHLGKPTLIFYGWYALASMAFFSPLLWDRVLDNP